MKKLFQEKYEAIDVPEEVQQAIKSGIQQAQFRQPQPVRRRKWQPLMLSAAVLGLLAGSFLITPVAQVLAQAPLVGPLYSQFNDLMGRKLEESELLTPLQQTVSDQGFEVTITSSYFDGGAFGLTFEVTGGEIEGEYMGEGVSYPVLYELFNGDPQVSETIELAYLTKTDTGYTGHITAPYPYDLDEAATVALKFLSIGKKEGDWSFEVPIEQLPYQTLELAEQRTNEEKNVRLDFTTALVGEVSTTINYTATFLHEMKYNQVRLAFYDDQGSEINQAVNGIRVSEKIENEQIIIEGRAIILSPIHTESAYIDVIPKVAIRGEDPNKPIELEAFRIYFPE